MPYSIECFGEIDEDSVQWLLLFNAFFLKLLIGEDHVYRGAAWSRACLTLRKDGICKALQPGKYDLGKYLSNYAEQGSSFHQWQEVYVDYLSLRW